MYLSRLIIKNSEEFKKLYQKVSDNEKVTEISDAVGITIVRKYNKDSEYFKDGKKMFINLSLRDTFLVGGIDMVEEEENGMYTIIFDNKKYKKKFTNFFFGPEEQIKFNAENNRVLVKRKNKNIEFCLNDFVDLLVKNHLSDRLFWAKKKNYFKRIILRILFFLTDDKYSYVDYYHKIHENKISEIKKEKEIKIGKEPFFNYFKIYKNMLFILSVILLLCILIPIEKYGLLDEGNFSISNPILLFLFIIILFLLHYFSSFLHIKKRDRKGFIYKLHNDCLNNSFRLKINL